MIGRDGVNGGATGASFRLGIDLTPVARGATGIGSYVRGLLGAREALGALSIRGWVNRPALLAPRLAGAELGGVPRVHTRVPRRLLNRMWLDRHVGGIEDLVGEIDVFHATDLLAPRARAAAVVLSVHDLAWHEAPELVDDRIRRLLERWFAASLALASAIVVPSTATARSLERLVPELGCAVHVTPYGVAQDFHPGATPRDDEVRARHGLRSGYVLYVGALDPRKGVLGLVPAHGALCDGRADKPSLVIVGPDAGSLPAIREQIRCATAPVHILGAVARADLPAIYRGARAFVFPSSHEGFGLPVIEAAGCGVPVVCTAVPALHELARGVARFVPAPAKPLAVARALDEVLRGGAEVEARVTVGVVRAASMTWERCAAATGDVYRAAIEHARVRPR